MSRKLTFCLVLLALLTGTSRAAFTLVEDFNALTTGAVNGQHGWVGGTTDGLVVTDPASATNRVLAVSTTSGTVYHALGSLSISNANTGTLSFRMRWPGTAFHTYIGLTDVTTPAAGTDTSDYETQVGADAAASSTLKVRDASAYDSIETLQSNTWYRVWMVHDNPHDLYAVYLQGGTFTNQVRLDGNSDGETWFTFRNTTGDGTNTNTVPQANALITFAIKSGSSHVGPLYVDDIYVDPTNANLSVPGAPADSTPPTVAILYPAAASVVPALTSVAVTFSEAVTNIAATNLLLNGVVATNLLGGGAAWTWQFPQPATGTVTVAWATNQAIADLASNRFSPAPLAWAYTLLPPDSTPPVVATVSPLPGVTVTTLTQIVVTFSEAVSGVVADDFLVNGAHGISFTSAGNAYTFTVAQPPQGAVTARFDAAHLITDLAGNRLDETAAGSSWSYTMVDTTPPAIALMTPPPDATITRLDAAEIYFSEPVSGVNAADLLINGTAATNLTGSGLGPYVFRFPQPTLGVVSLSWAAGHGIHDLSPQANAFAGGAWSNTLGTAEATGQPVLNEFLTANISTSGLYDEDGELSDWIEFFNPGPLVVNLTGWSLTDDAGDLGKWTFPALTLAAGEYRVVFASGKDRRVAGGASPLHTSFSLGSFGDYLALCPPDFPRAPAVEFAPKYPEQRNDYSYGLNASNQWRYFAAPTPGAANGDSSITQALDPVHFTMEHGLFNAPFPLVLVPPVPDAAIRYTTDGSLPTESNGADYTGPLTISTTTTLRAAAFRSDSLPSRVATATYIFPAAVLQQPANPPGFPITYLWSQYANWPSEYGMNQTVVNDPRYAPTLASDLQAIPSLSIVMNVEDMFGAANGIYTHADISGPAWERPCSIELINPDGSSGFVMDGGIQMHGGGSRARTLKHPFRIQFKGKYGAAKLAYPFFSDSPVGEFDTIDLRSDYNNHWNHGTDVAQRARGGLVRDAWFKDAQADMGDLAGHSRYVHLYINGLYWGVYNPCERADGSFGAAYLGGQPEDYDAYNGSGTVLVSGNAAAHNAMLAISNLQILSQYDLMRQYLDVTQYADYMLLQIYGANQDWGVSKNWYCLRKREAGAGFKYLCWDDERVFEDINHLPMGVGSVAALNSISPDNLQAKLVASPEYRLLFADRVQRHFFNGGVLTTNAIAASWQARAGQIDRAIVGESARWGATMTTSVSTPGQPGKVALSPLPYPGYTIGTPYTRDENWLGEQSRLLTNYFPARAAVVLNQLRTVGLYPTNVQAPAFSQFGGRVPRGFTLAMASTNTIYFTTNDTDPRVYGSGAIAASARLYTNTVPITLNASSVVKARALRGTTNWSALVEATFIIEERSSPLRITELMYAPVGGSSYEFLELFNAGATPVNLGGYSFDGINFAFAPGTSIGSGARLVLANNGNTNQWAARYPGVPVAGWYGGNLNNAGERIALLDAAGHTVFAVTYSSTSGWPSAANGGGYSVELAEVDGDPNSPANWRASTALNGSPGQTPSTPPATSVVLNEVMAWNVSTLTNGGTLPDWIELLNTGVSAVNLAGWSLSDDGDTRKFVFPTTNLPPGAFLVLWCDAATNTTPGLHTGFSLNKDGDEVFLFNAATNRVDAIGFGPQLADGAIGRIAGWWQLTTPTPGATNVAATLASATNLVLNEWLASAPPNGDDWLELFNRSTNAPVALRGLTLATTNATSQLRALSFLAPHGYLQLFADEKPGPAHLEFKLPATGGTNFLYDATGALIDQTAYGPQIEGVSQGRLPDGASTITNFVLSASPGASNYVADYTGPWLNEVCALNRTVITNTTGHTPDWVELWNPGATSFSLAGYRLGKSSDAGAAWVFPAGVAVPGSGPLLVWFDNDRPASTNLEAELNTGLPLTGGGDAVYLFNAQGLVVDAVAFGPQAPDLSIGRVNGAWRLLTTPTPAAANAPSATLDAPTALRLNEWLATSLAGEDEFFELFNPGALPVELSGLFVSDNLSVAGLTQFPIPPLSFIGPSGFTVLKADGHPANGRDHVNFKLDAQGESLRLYSTNAGILDTIVFGLQPAGISGGRLPDGAENFTLFTCATPGSSNDLATLHFDVQPQSVVIAPGTPASFHANASGFGSLGYQWLHAGVPVPSATSKTLALPAAQFGDAGPYAVVVTNACGSLTSAVATLTVALPPRLSAITGFGGNGFQFLLEGQVGLRCAIEKSTNLVEWTLVSTVTLTNSPLSVLDPSATNAPVAFYRAGVVP